MGVVGEVQAEAEPDHRPRFDRGGGNPLDVVVREDGIDLTVKKLLIKWSHENIRESQTDDKGRKGRPAQALGSMG